MCVAPNVIMAWYTIIHELSTIKIRSHLDKNLNKSNRKIKIKTNFDCEFHSINLKIFRNNVVFGKF